MRLLIVGATARAAAASARRAGLRPITIDRFADRDHRILADAHRSGPEDDPRGLVALAGRLPPGPWIYTGPMENAPEAVDQIAANRPLWGNPGRVLRRVRDPSLVAEVLRDLGVPRPDLSRAPEGLPRDGTWLAKPVASAGGLGVDALDETCATDGDLWFQERVDGPSVSAVYLGRGGDGADLVGASRQWVGSIAGPFAYRGSLGPWPLGRGLADRIGRVGAVLASAFGLVGLFGVDFILNGGVPWPVEVNPRYTASVEVLELAFGWSLLARHARAFDHDQVTRCIEGPGPRGYVGKVVVYAEGAGHVPEACDRIDVPADPWDVPTEADLPDSGTPLEPGDPVLTAFARGPTLAACARALHDRAAFWRGRLRDARPRDCQGLDKPGAVS